MTLYVRFGSLGDICAATNDVRFTPDSDHESGQGQWSCLLCPRKRRAKRTLATLFDHLVRDSKDTGRNG
jgi:hypothetical protein